MAILYRDRNKPNWRWIASPHDYHIQQTADNVDTHSVLPGGFQST